MFVRESVFVAFFFFLLSNCSSERNNAVSRIELDGNDVNLFQLEYVNDSIELNLSEIAEDLHFIRLETSSECILNRPEFFVGEDYIIAFDKRRSIVQFDGAGKYIRTITTHGQGPNEVTNYKWAVDEMNNILYLKDRYDDYFLSYDLNQGVFLQKIPIAIPCDVVQFLVLSQDVFLIAPTVTKSIKESRYYAFWQDSKGKLLAGIPAPEKLKVNDGSQILFENSEGIAYYYYKSDTLFSIGDYAWSSEWIFRLSSSSQEDLTEPESKSFKVISYQDNFILSSLFVAGTTTRNENVVATSGKLYYLFINRVNERADYVKQLNVDIIHRPIRPVSIKTQANGTIFIEYDALQLKDLIEETLQDPAVTIQKMNELKELNKAINSEDNPVLLVGKVRSGEIFKNK